ncbi:NlpC/P60 family protein [Streptomyces sp. KLOTTS4A1]|uniref:C40 family peptidase n=1 Tax=Streptomyces sp. KLOTTS4A1 TaxID=3390996 RepID=UPI0039F5F6E3
MASHRRTAPSDHRGRWDRTARATVVSAAVATAAASLTAAPAGADPAEPAEGTRAEVERLYAEAERATEAYNKADEKAGKLEAQVDRARDRLARGQERINTMRGRLGSLAGAQYRSGGLDPTLALMLSDDPDQYLDKAATLNRISARQAGELAALQDAQRDLAQRTDEARRKLAELQDSRATVAKQKRIVKKKLAQARRLLNALPGAERAAYERASRSGRDPLPPVAGAPSARAAAALAAVRQAVGRPYVWGANGPSGFDCSGLTQWAYAQAGVGLPRTSQAQRHAGRQVPLAQAQPGDLVTYRADASHVAMYVGDGQVVHAPYPGASVRYDPVGMMPVSSVTRV